MLDQSDYSDRRQFETLLPQQVRFRLDNEGCIHRDTLGDSRVPMSIGRDWSAEIEPHAPTLPRHSLETGHLF